MAVSISDIRQLMLSEFPKLPILYSLLTQQTFAGYREVCLEWVNCLTETLRRLSILGDTTNIYGVTPLIRKCEVTETPTPLDNLVSRQVEMSTDASLRHNVHTRDPHSPNRASHVHSPHSLRPPLPPRSNQIFPSRPPTAASDEKHEETTYDVITSQPRISCDNEKESNWYDSPRGFYDALSSGASLSNISSSPLDSTMSTSSLCSSLSSELRLSTSIPSAEIASNDYDTLRSQVDLPVRSVSLNLSVLVEHVMFVEVAGRVWIAGWSEIKDPQLSLLFSFGDELIEVEKIPVQGFANVTQLFYSVFHSWHSYKPFAEANSVRNDPPLSKTNFKE
ncbi:hypothetical protein KIN20_031764 [Parelaphostrongylus tenuis]|uniref:Uncharacterized protein n=1 Tax=Parelaphostrongylus tenuis TaxID=148309 RepID=A0AAD5R5U5_PARTN|nr:hypothetical protein KIN20_031764 [Parelaphostrongylus tenuis]